jgi:hypothetical protein
MHPFGFNRIEPGTLRGQQERQNPHTLVRLFDLLVVLTMASTVPGAEDAKQQMEIYFAASVWKNGIFL